jgi:hypothetical protein
VYIFLVVITLVCYVSRISINVLLSSNFLISTKDCVSAYKRSSYYQPDDHNAVC